MPLLPPLPRQVGASAGANTLQCGSHNPTPEPRNEGIQITPGVKLGEHHLLPPVLKSCKRAHMPVSHSAALRGLLSLPVSQICTLKR